MPVRGGSSATVTRLEMRLSVMRASREIVDSFRMTAAIITRSRPCVNVVIHTFESEPERAGVPTRAARVGWWMRPDHKIKRSEDPGRYRSRF